MKLRKSIIKFILGAALGLAVIVLLAFNALLMWVATGPRSLDAFSSYIEAAFEPVDHSYSLSIGQTWLVWDGWRHPIDIRLRDVKVVTNQRHAYSRFPELSLGLDIIGLLEGRIFPTSLTITHPVIGLLQNDDHTISFGLESEKGAAEVQENTAVPFAAIMAPFITPDEQGSLRHLHLVSIVNADVRISSRSKGVFFKTSGANITFKRNHRELQAHANASIAYDHYQTLVSAQLIKKNDSSIVNCEVTVDKLMPGTLADLFTDNTVLGAMKFPISGKAIVQADVKGPLQKLNFVVDSGEGTFEYSKLDGPLPINKLHAEGQVEHNTDTNANNVQLSKLAADLQDAILEGQGTAAVQGNDAEVHANLSLKNVAMAKAHLFWPPSLAPETREWVTANVSEGTISEIKAVFNIAPGDLAKKDLPKADVDAHVAIEGATLRYLPEHPPLTALNTTIHIDGMSLDAQVNSAHYMKDTKLSQGRVLIEDLNPDNPYIKVNVTAESTAKDVIHLLELPPLKHAQRLNLKADEAEGKIKGQAMLVFRFFAARDENGNASDGEDIDFAVKAELASISQNGFMKRFDGKNVMGSLTIDNKTLEFIGGGDVNGAVIHDADIRYLFKPESGFDTFIKVTATAPVAVLPRFGYPAFDFLKGVVGVKADIKESDTVESTEATIDLTNAAVAFPTFHILKPDKEPANLTLTTERKGDTSTIPDFAFKSKNIDTKGSMELSKDMSGIRRLRTNKLVIGSTYIDQLIYEFTNNQHVVDMRGTRVDLSSWFDTKDSKEEGVFSFEQFPPVQLKTDVAHVIFGQGRELLKVKGTIDCTVRRCESANIIGTTPDSKPFNFRMLRNPKGKRQLSLHVQSAGMFLKNINMFDGMEGGDLTVTGNYTEEADGNGSILRGHADINEHTIKNASVLAKILSLASLTGFFDTLQGKGIYFSRLSAPFTLAKDVITLQKAKTHGDALGMTADGTMTFPKGILDIQGTIVPSYTLNNVLGKVPLIGNMLTGGEGQGVFAARYSVKGTQGDPQISVNPLSILTPGFLRGLFDILDSPKKKEEDEED